MAERTADVSRSQRVGRSTRLIFGGAAGLAIGAGIGKFAPGVYIVQFRATRNEDGSLRADFPFVDVGAGFGLMQGAIMSLLAGLILVALVTWYAVRTSTANSRKIE